MILFSTCRLGQVDLKTSVKPVFAAYDELLERRDRGALVCDGNVFIGSQVHVLIGSEVIILIDSEVIILIGSAVQCFDWLRSH